MKLELELNFLYIKIAPASFATPHHAPTMIMDLNDEVHVDIIPCLLVFCSATSLCKLAQTCRFFRSLILDKAEETAIVRLELFRTGRERLWELLKEFGGMTVANTGIVLSTVFHIDKAMLVEAQKSVVEEMMKKTSLIIDNNTRRIVEIQMSAEGVKLMQNFWDRGVFPFESKMKELYYFEKTEASFFDTVVTLQSLVFVFLSEFASSDLIAWLKSKVSIIPLSILPLFFLSL